MNKIDEKILKWREQGKNIALATLVKVYGSAPQPLGAKMGISEDLSFWGSVSGGCVEGDLIDQALRVIKTSSPKLIPYGISDDSAWSFGLSCGGTIEVFVEPFQPLHEQIYRLQQTKKLFAVLTVLSGERIGEKQIVQPEAMLDKDKIGLDTCPAIHELLTRAFQNQKSEKVVVAQDDEEYQVFCEVYSPPARLIIIGAVHIAMPLAEFARLLGFTTIVLDARTAFANRERFPLADQIIVGWPAEELEKLEIDENSFIAFVSHDEKFDIPALNVALQSKARYIGALGSRKTHANRLNSLLRAGVPAESLSRIHAPIGLDIGAAGAQEIALSIIAEMTTIRNGMTNSEKS